MKKTINIVAALIKSLFTFIAFTFIAVIFYNDIKTYFGIILSIIIFIIGIYISYQVFQYIVRRGILEAITENSSTSDLDNLIPTEASDYRKISVQKLETHFKTDSSLCVSGKIRIWGDWNQRDLDIVNKIETIYFDKNDNSLVFEFQNKNKISIWNPSQIYESTTYLKIIKASKIKWEWNSFKNFQVYKYTPKAIETFTNSKWKIHPFDTSIKKIAFYLQ